MVWDYRVALSPTEPRRWRMVVVSAKLLSMSRAPCSQALASPACLVLPRLAAGILHLPLFPQQMLSADPTLLLLPHLSSLSSAFSSAQHHCPVLPFPKPSPELLLSPQAPKAPLSTYEIIFLSSE